MDIIAYSKNTDTVDFENKLIKCCKDFSRICRENINAVCSMTITSCHKNIKELKGSSVSNLKIFINNSESVNNTPITKVLNYIEKNYMNDISLFEISALVSFTPHYFCNFFKKETGRSFGVSILSVPCGLFVL